MVSFAVTYATPSSYRRTNEQDSVGFAANQCRRVRFHAKVDEHRFMFRAALRALGEVVWSDDTWVSEEEYLSYILDPIITVHEDRVFFEAFSQDQSVYGAVIADREIFTTSGEVATGTTNVDFTRFLYQALGDMRSSRETWLRVEPEGFAVETENAPGRVEGKVDVPDDWVRGFLQLQSAMAMPGTRLTVRPVDLLAAIRYLRFSKAKISPRALRYELPPNEHARIVLEPWEQIVPLKGTEHNYEELRVIRTWGRRRLRLLEPLLPYADVVDIYLKGRALPTFYVVHLPGVRLLLGLSGWTSNNWTSTGSFDLSSSQEADQPLYERTVQTLSKKVHGSVNAIAEDLGADREQTAVALSRMCRLGRAIYDVEQRAFRHRELFAEPIDEKKLYPPDPRLEKARRLLDQVTVKHVGVRETRKQKKLKTPDGPVRREIVYRDWEVRGSAEDHETEIVVKDTGQIIFGKCSCPFFQENILNKGPCEHMIALLSASAKQRVDLPTSTVAEQNEHSNA